MEQIKYFFISLRPYQWTKNLLVFAALIFSGNLFNLDAFISTFLLFILFSLAAGAGYVFNDLLDREKDQFHPEKKFRPIASGKLNVKLAILMGALLLLFSITFAFKLDLETGFVLFLYVSLTLLYTLSLKHVVILDLLTIAAGYVLRAIAGATVIDVFISPWLLVCTFFLALFLIIGKRRHELILLADKAQHHRLSLNFYDPKILDLMLAIMGASTIVTYTLYLLNSISRDPDYPVQMLLTLPLVIFGLFRYFYLVFHKELGGKPEHILVNDVGISLATLGWFLIVMFNFYVS